MASLFEALLQVQGWSKQRWWRKSKELTRLHMRCYFNFQLLPTWENTYFRWCSCSAVVCYPIVSRMDLLLQTHLLSHFLSPTCGMVLLKPHPMARQKTSTSINLTGCFAVVFFTYRVGLAWTKVSAASPGDLGSFWGQI